MIVNDWRQRFISLIHDIRKFCIFQSHRINFEYVCGTMSTFPSVISLNESLVPSYKLTWPLVYISLFFFTQSITKEYCFFFAFFSKNIAFSIIFIRFVYFICFQTRFFVLSQYIFSFSIFHNIHFHYIPID